ncbi:hypothetical protein BDK51DRAFT_38859 [Blyttiomyces helicus]|uniref:Uncharacterized protein n=1 Tax=Blyttiomyces helicus TaxID=388810 RepID=A0A4P9W0I5_9FUNG|nr:hypothetical protein BDK51DRAFT_38859 [Blyttiomyces helicus]|eukprot:RKO83536.1 hypothetical protein BDK51DRAFT_38859 [Blyttiomyces helicus]
MTDPATIMNLNLRATLISFLYPHIFPKALVYIPTIIESACLFQAGATALIVEPVPDSDRGLSLPHTPDAVAPASMIAIGAMSGTVRRLWASGGDGAAGDGPGCNRGDSPHRAPPSYSTRGRVGDEKAPEDWCERRAVTLSPTALGKLIRELAKKTAATAAMTEKSKGGEERKSVATDSPTTGGGKDDPANTTGTKVDDAFTRTRGQARWQQSSQSPALHGDETPDSDHNNDKNVDSNEHEDSSDKDDPKPSLQPCDFPSSCFGSFAP